MDKFLPEQLKKHPDLIDYQDVISVVLDPKTFYEVEEAKRILRERFLDKEVN